MVTSIQFLILYIFSCSSAAHLKPRICCGPTVRRRMIALHLFKLSEKLDEPNLQDIGYDILILRRELNNEGNDSSLHCQRK